MTAASIRYSTSADGITAVQVAGGFFEGWVAAPSPDQHLHLLHGSSHVVIALDGDAVVGFVTALSDGILSVYIPLLEVLPSHRHRGIASELVRRLLLEIGPLYMVDVMCDADVFPVYERLGFTPAAGGIIRNYGWHLSSR